MNRKKFTKESIYFKSGAAPEGAAPPFIRSDRNYSQPGFCFRPTCFSSSHGFSWTTSNGNG